MYTYSSTIGFGGMTERKLIQNSEKWNIINVSKTKIDSNEQHIPLDDGDGQYTQENFAHAVQVVRTHIQQDNPVFIHCAIGQSRSISVLATAIAVEHNRNVTTVIDELTDIRGSFTKPNTTLQSKAKTYIQNTTQ